MLGDWFNNALLIFSFKTVMKKRNFESIFDILEHSLTNDEEQQEALEGRSFAMHRTTLLHTFSP
jgi:hypothetical protein